MVTWALQLSFDNFAPLPILSDAPSMCPFAEPVMVFLRLAGDKSSVAALKLPLCCFVLASLAYPVVPSGLQTKTCRCPYNQLAKGDRPVPPGRACPREKGRTTDPCLQAGRVPYLKFCHLGGVYITPRGKCASLTPRAPEVSYSLVTEPASMPCPSYTSPSPRD